VENVQNVPIAVTVVSGDTFGKANVSGFADVAKFAPLRWLDHHRAKLVSGAVPRPIPCEFRQRQEFDGLVR
jgi:hypothetical protein